MVEPVHIGFQEHVEEIGVVGISAQMDDGMYVCNGFVYFVEIAKVANDGICKVCIGFKRQAAHLVSAP